MGKSRLAVLAIGTAVLVSLTAFVPAEYHETVRAVAALGSITPLNLVTVMSTGITVNGQEVVYGCQIMRNFPLYYPKPDETSSEALKGRTKCYKDTFVNMIISTYERNTGIKLLFALLLWFTVVAKYPIVDRDGDNDKSAGGEVLRIGIMDCCSCYKGTMGNCMWALLFPNARAAATMHSTGTMNYFLACICMSTPFFSSLVLCYVSLGTDMWEKLGGNIPDCCSATFQSFFCMPCKIAREAAALDAVQGRETTLCGVAQKVSNDYRQYP